MSSSCLRVVVSRSGSCTLGVYSIAAMSSSVMVTLLACPRGTNFSLASLSTISKKKADCNALRKSRTDICCVINAPRTTVAVIWDTSQSPEVKPTCAMVAVQIEPSVTAPVAVPLIITWLVPLCAIAQKSPRAGAHATPNQPSASATGTAVHVVPSGEVMLRFVPSKLTAQNSNRSGDQVTPVHVFCSDAVRAVQLMPSGDVITRCVPL